MTELSVVADRVEQAGSYAEVFGPNVKDGMANELKRDYRKLTRVLHPDRYTVPAERARAERAFVRLNELYGQAQAAVRAGNYGQVKVLATIRTRKQSHQILRSLGRGDLCATYAAKTSGALEQASFVKIAATAADADLLQAEAAALKRLHGADADPQWEPFVPDLLDSFSYQEVGKPRRPANVLKRLDGFYNLDQVRQAFPAGLSPLHMVWIWRRLLVTLGYAHDNQVVHGAVLPRHVMILPEQHGLVLVDWCYASLGDDGTYPAVKAIVDAHRDWYPPEVLAKQPPSPATDIVMAARCMIELLGGDPLTGNLPAGVPRPLRAFLKGCLQTRQAARPHDAWLLLKEFDELLERIGTPYYPRRFRPFTMPTGVV